MIILEDVNKTYSAGIPAIKNVNLRIEKGEFVFIVGNSGAGKSTLIKLLLNTRVQSRFLSIQQLQRQSH